MSQAPAPAFEPIERHASDDTHGSRMYTRLNECITIRASNQGVRLIVTEVGELPAHISLTAAEAAATGRELLRAAGVQPVNAPAPLTDEQAGQKLWKSLNRLEKNEFPEKWEELREAFKASIRAAARSVLAAAQEAQQ